MRAEWGFNIVREAVNTAYSGRSALLGLPEHRGAARSIETAVMVTAGAPTAAALLLWYLYNEAEAAARHHIFAGNFLCSEKIAPHHLAEALCNVDDATAAKITALAVDDDPHFLLTTQAALSVAVCHHFSLFLTGPRSHCPGPSLFSRHSRSQQVRR